VHSPGFLLAPLMVKAKEMHDAMDQENGDLVIQ
jgi:hypothetical protein